MKFTFAGGIAPPIRGGGASQADIVFVPQQESTGLYTTKPAQLFISLLGGLLYDLDNDS
jgi:hypothetical protein